MIYNKLLSLNLNKITERAALNSAFWIGQKNKNAADKAAVDGMRQVFKDMLIRGEVVVGEGERDNAPMLYVGEKVGRGHGIKLDFAIDPLEGTNLCALNKENAISILVATTKGGILKCPDLYMQKIAVPFNNKNIIDIKSSVKENIKNLARFKGCHPKQLTAVVLKRERHVNIIHDLHSLGVKVRTIEDGDILEIVNMNILGSADIYIGIGGAPEGIIAAAALKCLGGQMQARFITNSVIQEKQAKSMGISRDKVYNISDMIKKDLVLYASGITDGSLLNGVKYVDNKKYVNSIFITSFPNANLRKFTSCYDEEF